MTGAQCTKKSTANSVDALIYFQNISAIVLLGLRMGRDVFDGVCRRYNFVGVVVGNLQCELLFERHDQLYCVQTV